MSNTSKSILLVAILSFLSTFSAHAQLRIIRSTLGSCGNSFQIQDPAGRTYLLQSVGQASVIGSGMSGEVRVRQGFIQPMLGLQRVEDDGVFEVEVFPNPFQESINVRIVDGTGPWTLTLLNMEGRVVRELGMMSFAERAITISGLQSGIYFLRIQGPRSSETIKIVKQ